MPWTTTCDLGEFLAAAGGFLRSRLVEHNVLLSITAWLPRADRPGPGEPPLLGWWAEEPGPRGAFIATAGYPLAVTPMPGQALDELADTLAIPLAGIGAQAGAACRFARRWQGRTGTRATAHRRQRLYRLGQLVPADPPPGRARRAADATAACCMPGPMRSSPNWAAPRSGTFPRRSPTGWDTATWCCGKQAESRCPWPGAPR